MRGLLHFFFWGGTNGHEVVGEFQSPEFYPVRQVTPPAARVVFLSCCLVASFAIGAPVDKVKLRKTRPKDVSLNFERLVLANGQVSSSAVSRPRTEF